MTPKEKATEIVFKMFAEWMQIPYQAVSYHLRIPAYTLGLEWNMTKHCALITVDEIINSNPYKLSLEGEFLTEHITYDINFWEEVKKEINKL